MKKLILIFLLILAAILLFLYASYDSGKNDLEGRLAKWEVGINAMGIMLTDFSESSMGGLVKETLEAKSDSASSGGEDVILQMTKVTSAATQKYIDDKKFLLESLFLPTTSPYPGVITNIRECPEEFKPKMQEVQDGAIYVLLAGSRFNYGVCAQDLVEYYSAYGIFDCKEKGIFEVRVFSKTDEAPQNIAQSFEC